jgi:RNA methyltransferase, TrmH family
MGLSQRREHLVARLRAPKTRAREHAVLVEGVRAATEALDAGVDVSFALTSPRLESTEAGRRLAARLETRDVVAVSDEEIASLSDTERPQGVLMVCKEPEAALDDLEKGGRYLVFDGVQDPGNAGTLARAAVAFGLDGVVYLDRSVDPWSPKTVRASAGMVFRLPVVRATAAELVGRLAEAGIPLYVADAEGEDATKAKGGSFALVMGNEGEGVRDEVRAAADASLAVRMPGPAESLNVAMAGAILLHRLTT